MDCRNCSSCGESRPFPDGFAKDARKPGGRRYVCKICERKATNARRADARIGRRPGALVLVPKFPTPPADSSPPDDAPAAPTQTKNPGGVGASRTYVDAAEKVIAALDPPADDADALLVRNLRGLAELADQAAFREEPTRELSTLTTSMVRVQRELAATRIARAKTAPVEAPAKRTAANY